ncbi:hypothetical protein [Planomicrobium okeanokoites]|uniref:hypothetical protein n=1 Tax=Planomicrobium okeanokoites TaxID=244 RepID=UPI0030FCF1F5
MLTESILYKNPKTKRFQELEEWMKFAHFLGWYMEEQKEALKVYVSVPSNLLFSYFITLGAVDYKFHRKINDDNLLSKFFDLQPGSQVLYLSGTDWKKCTVLGVEDFPGASGGTAIKVKDNKNSITYISERKWLTNLRVFNEDVSEFKNAKKVSNVTNLSENRVLNFFYSKQSLSTAELSNSPEIIISAIKKEWIENLSLINLMGMDHVFDLSNFIFFEENKSTFTNIEFVSEKVELSKERLEDVTGLFIGAGRCLRKIDEFKQTKSFYLVDRYESTDRIDDLQQKIEQIFLMDKCASANERLLKRIQEASIPLPKGVDLFAWQ